MCELNIEICEIKNIKMWKYQICLIEEYMALLVIMVWKKYYYDLLSKSGVFYGLDTLREEDIREKSYVLLSDCSAILMLWRKWLIRYNHSYQEKRDLFILQSYTPELKRRLYVFMKKIVPTKASLLSMESPKLVFPSSAVNIVKNSNPKPWKISTNLTK